MKITEAKLRQMIRGVIREFTSGASAGGATQRGGYESDATKARKTAYTTAKNAIRVAEPTYTFRGQTLPAKYTRSGRGGTEYSATGGKGFSANSSYTAYETDKATKDAAEAKALTALQQSQAADRAATEPTEEPPAAAAGTGGYGTGKSAGKGKGKKKKN